MARKLIDRDKMSTGSEWFADAMNGLGEIVSDGVEWFNDNISPEGVQNRQNREFQEQQNAITMQREDTAFQRAATDLQNAGLSKTLAAGSPSPTSPMVAPRDMNSTNSTIDNFLSMIGLKDTLANSQKAREKEDAEIGLINAQTDNTNAQSALNQMDVEYYARNNLSPAQNNKWIQLVTSIWDMVSNWWNNKFGGSNWVDPVEPRSIPYSSHKSEDGFKLNMNDSSNLMPALAAPSYSTEFKESYPIEKRMVPRNEATGASFDRGMADYDTLELVWTAIGPAVMDSMLDLPNSFTENLRYNENTCHMYLENGADYEKLAPEYFADLRDNLMIANGWNEPVAETMIKYALIYGVKNRMW